MKVLYDISVLGVGQYNPLARTGVARVVENVAYGLADSKECDLSFCQSLSFEVLKACLAYRQINPRLKNIPLVHSRLLSTIHNKLTELHFLLDTSNKINNGDGGETEYNVLLKEVMQSLEKNVKQVEAYSSLPEVDKVSETDIFHATFFPIPEQIRKAKNTKVFLTVYDLIPILYPHFFKENRKTQRTIDSVGSLNTDDWVFCISEATKNDLCNHLNYIKPEKVFVTHLAADHEIFYPCSNKKKINLIKKKYRVPDVPYVLGLSTLEPRKNIDHVIRCFVQLVQEQNIKDLALVLVGNLGWDYNKIIEEASSQTSLKNRIIFSGRVADEDLAALYSGATVFVYPSFYEGFGLPPLEAMQCGIPVITSNTSSLPEVVGDAGIMLDPKDNDGLCHSILEIYKKPSLRETMSLKSLKQAKRFSWYKCTQNTISAYKKALI